MITQLRYEVIIERALRKNNNRELAIGSVRYETLRKLNTRQFAYLNKLNLGGRNFDDMVDEIATGTFDWSGLAFFPRFIGETET